MLSVGVLTYTFIYSSSSNIYLSYNTSPGNMHIPSLCFALYYTPDMGCCRPKTAKFIFHGKHVASFPGPSPASRRLQYGKRREAGLGPGNEASKHMLSRASGGRTCYEWRIALSINIGVLENH